MYEYDIFYNTSHLTVEQLKQLLFDAKEVCYHWHVDYLDCSVSYARQQIDMSFDEILNKLDTKSHFVFIHRRGFLDTKPKNNVRSDFNLNDWCLETGFTTMRGITHYLWINVEEKYIDMLVNKYNLTQKF